MGGKNNIVFKFFAVIGFFVIPICGIIFILFSVGLIMDVRRDIGRYIYATYNQLKVTFTIMPKENYGLILSVYEDSIPPQILDEYEPIAQYEGFISKYEHDAFYCGVRDSVCPDGMFLWVKPYGEEIYAHDSKTIHFRTYISPPNSMSTNVFDVNFGLYKMHISPECKEGLTIYEMPWYIILYNCLASNPKRTN